MQKDKGKKKEKDEGGNDNDKGDKRVKNMLIGKKKRIRTTMDRIGFGWLLGRGQQQRSIHIRTRTTMDRIGF